ncbi:MAG: NINE protein [Myxococcota bacterium]
MAGADDLKQLAELRARGILSEEEFDAEKATILAGRQSVLFATGSDAPGRRGSISRADDLKKLADLKAQGILTEEEFDVEKATILAGGKSVLFEGESTAIAQRPPQEVAVGRRDWVTTLLLALFLGGAGIHRFYTGHTAIGIVQLLTGGGCGIWALVDVVLIATGSYKDADGLLLKKP